MQISNDEINRLLALMPKDKAGVSKAGSRSPLLEAQSAAEAAATVDVSTSSQDVQFVKKVLDRLPDVREDRVAALKAQIEGGTYKVSGEDIADLMIRRSLADNALL